MVSLIGLPYGRVSSPPPLFLFSPIAALPPFCLRHEQPLRLSPLRMGFHEQPRLRPTPLNNMSLLFSSPEASLKSRLPSSPFFSSSRASSPQHILILSFAPMWLALPARGSRLLPCATYARKWHALHASLTFPHHNISSCAAYSVTAPALPV